MAPGYVFQVSLRVTFQNQVRIAQRVIVDEVIQFRQNTKNPNPSPIGKKFGFCCCGAPPGTRTLGPLIKRNRCATSVNFQNHAVSLFLAFCRDFTPCILCIICTRCSALHLLSSYSGVQKVCKNVQSQNQPLKTAPDFYAMG